MQEELRLHGLGSVNRFEGFDGFTARLPDGWDYGPGSYGCLRSHYGVISAAREKKLPSILILEDDVEFHPDLNVLFGEYVAQLPSDWDAVLLGGMHLERPQPVSAHVVRLRKTSSTFAWAVRRTMYDAFLDINRDTMIAVDENNHILQQNFRFYGFMPHLAWVTRDHSDVMGAEVNPWWLRHSVVLYGPESEHTLQRFGVIVFFDSNPFKGRAEAESHVKLLQSVLRLYMAIVAPTAICVVERGRAPLLKPEDLPMLCHYRFFQPSASPFRCAQGAAAVLDGKSYFVCAPYDVYPLRSELRASMLMCCGEYDIVTPLHQPLPLTHEDTQKMVRDEVSLINTGDYPPLPAEAPTADFCIVATRLLHDGPSDQVELLTPSLLERSRVFRSPGRLVRLRHPPRAACMAAF